MNDESPEVINRIVKLIRDYMRLPQDHVVAYNQMVPIPKDEGIFIAVGILDSPVWALSVDYKSIDDPAPNGSLIEKQSSRSRDVFSIQIMSRNNDARKRRKEVLYALNGVSAQQEMERHGFLIGRIPVSFVDASITEGAERLNRYVATFNVLTADRSERSVDFYDKLCSQQLVTQE